MKAVAGDDIEVGVQEDPSFGKVLYEVDEVTSMGCCGYINKKFTLRFYENALMVENTDTYCCYPKAYDRVVIPKYRLVNVQFHKARVGALVYLGSFLLIVGIVLLAVGGESDDDEDVDTYIACGCIGLILGIFLLIYPFLFKYYTIALEIRSKGGVGNSAFGKWNLNAKTEWLLLNTSSKPDADVIMDYVYGSLTTSMDDFHSLSHLLDDSLVGEVRPRSVKSAVGKD